jgi:hypothetical protein
VQNLGKYERQMWAGAEFGEASNLGWDFAFELNEIAKQQAAAANIQMRFLRIPRDVMDKRAVEQGDIHFFELAALSVDVKTAQPRSSIAHVVRTSQLATLSWQTLSSVLSH